MRKIPEPVFKQVDIKKWGQTLNNILNECILETDTLDISVDDKLGSFSGDEKLLTQVLINLVKNASHAPQLDEEKKIVVNFAPLQGKALSIKVWNNGEEIDNEIIDKIFIPFFTTRENGAGIGLYLSRKIITQHGGTLTVQSKKGTGTTFTISL
ncbi:MAG: ATP-binding protein [Chloroflexia bacterium]|nr:ATP-binding protein [Chloroflexia bacterium]